eukprot:10948362-Alexandrium_andersonii.AAC.1
MGEGGSISSIPHGRKSTHANAAIASNAGQTYQRTSLVRVEVAVADAAVTQGGLPLEEERRASRITSQ